MSVLILTPPDDAKCAFEAVRMGAFNYVVKVGNYYDLLNLLVNEAINKYNERDQMRETIIALKSRVSELEGRHSIVEKEGMLRAHREAEFHYRRYHCDRHNATQPRQRRIWQGRRPDSPSHKGWPEDCWSQSG